MILCYNKPADMSYLGWEKQALPLGNGKIGVKVFGGEDCELIHFNEKTLWSGGKDVPGFCGGISNPDKGKGMREIQELLIKGDRKGATEKMHLLEGNMEGFGAYQSFGNLYFQFEKFSEVSNYVRDLDLETASSMVSFQSKKATYTRHYFVSYPDNVFVGRLKAEGEDAKLSFNAYVVSEQKGTPKAEGNTILLEGTVTANNGIGAAEGKEKNSMKYGCAVRIIPEDGTAEALGNGTISVKDATSVVVIMSLATDYINDFPNFSDGSDPLKKALSAVEKASEKSFGELYRTHLEDYQALFNRVKFTLGEDESLFATDRMLKRFSKKGEHKRALYTTLFQYGRYLLIASSRDGSLPANLQGIWNAKNNPPWCCDYHFNVNVQMNYWGAYAANLTETTLPYIDFVNSLKKPGRIVANKTLGIGEDKDGEPDYNKATGYMFHTMVTPLGFVGPGSDWKWGWAPTNGAWALQNMYDYYLFTLDTEKLRKDIYPAMEECALMWSQLLIEDKNSGRLVCSPGFSPEHGPVAAGNTYDQTIIYDLYQSTIEAAEVLISKGFENEVNTALIEKIKVQIEKLQPVKIGKWGQVKEWYDEDSFFMRGFYNQNVQRKHRHISHLLCLYPFRQINPEDEKLLNACLTTLSDRGDKSTGWGLAMRILCYARLLKGNKCDDLIRQFIRATVLDNLFSTHPPFQIDGNFGLLAGICEMLLQSHLGYIQLLPALPDSWSEGEISGLLARGNFEVSLKWKDSKLKEGTVKSNCGEECKLRYDGKILIVYDEEGNEVEASFQNGTTSFNTEKGKTYKFS